MHTIQNKTRHVERARALIKFLAIFTAMTLVGWATFVIAGPAAEVNAPGVIQAGNVLFSVCAITLFINVILVVYHSAKARE